MFVLCKWYCFCVMSYNIMQLYWNESVHVCSICGNIQYGCCILISQLFFQIWQQMKAAIWLANIPIWWQHLTWLLYSDWSTIFKSDTKLKATFWLVNIPIWWQHPIMKTAIWLANIPIWWQHPIWLLHSDWSTIFQIWHQMKAALWLAN